MPICNHCKAEADAVKDGLRTHEYFSESARKWIEWGAVQGPMGHAACDGDGCPCQHRPVGTHKGTPAPM